ncbi:hypothetical protein CPB84DRAFT_1793975 [Gymnopilus junonius]|uniref:F-box domain-containing protein n=1 Tax=Gymnopilus junonius TaxID=109634 RepID=A0A9P5TGM4_GYMJU|nr:hypothetical protein CPB84DRAFT_1793975 [Gymnopilus junonius]
MSPPPGIDLTVGELLAALRWKFDNGDVERGVLSITSEWEIDSGAYGQRPTDLRRKLSTKLRYLTKPNPPAPYVPQLAVNYVTDPILSINSFPLEILTKIFSLVQNLDAHQFPPPYYYSSTDHESWREINLVCQSWRHICLNTPSLWRYVAVCPDLVHPGLPVTMHIERSSPGPFEVRIDYLGETDDSDDEDSEDENSEYDEDDEDNEGEVEAKLQQVTSSIIRNRHRLEALYILSTPTISEDTSILEILQHEFPNLKSFYLKQSRHQATVPFENGSISPFFASPIEKLMLYEFLNLPPPNSAPHLKELYLKFPSYSDSSSPDSRFHQFLDFLETCPHLETLYLQSMDWNVPLHRTLRSVHLPALKHIELSDLKHPDEPFLFHNLVLASDVKIVWPCTFVEDRTEDRIFLYPPVPYLKEITTVFVKNSFVGPCELFKHTFIVSFNVDGLGSYCRDEDGQHDSALAIVVKSLPRLFPNIRSLTMDVFFRRTFSWDVIFRGYLSLERLQFPAGHLSEEYFLKLKDLDNDYERVLPSLSQIDIYVLHRAQDCLCQKISRKGTGTVYVVNFTEMVIRIPSIDTLYQWCF